jgi:hypothetical protein
MADMFDINIPGLGWHIPIALIALAALFIACFAVTGYISYRDDSIPTNALKDGNPDRDNFTITGGIELSGQHFSKGMIRMALGILPVLEANEAAGPQAAIGALAGATIDADGTNATDEYNAAALRPNHLQKLDFAGGGNGRLFLPKAYVGTVVQLRTAGNLDRGDDKTLKIQCHPGDFYAPQKILRLGGANPSNELSMPSSDGSHTKLVLTCGEGTVNAGVFPDSAFAAGTRLDFVAGEAGKWIVNILDVEKGDGDEDGLQFE